MFKISNSAKNRASIFSPSVWGPGAQCCGTLPSGQVEYLLHNMHVFKPFQKAVKFFGEAVFPEHGECCSDYGSPNE